MARRGRKRKMGLRTPAGRLKRTETVTDIISVAVAQRAKVVPLKKARDHRADRPLGILFLNGRITEEECEAGDRFGRLACAMRWAISAPSPNPAGVEARQWARAEDPDAETDAELRRRARARFDEAQTALKDAGVDAMLAVVEGAVHERPVPEWRLPALRRGLVALGEHFGLSGRA